MFIRILLIFILSTLFVVAYYMNKNKENFSLVLAGEKPKEPIVKVFDHFAKACLVLAVLGIICLIFGHKTVTLVYIGVVMLVSAIFSINLSKLIS